MEGRAYLGLKVRVHNGRAKAQLQEQEADASHLDLQA